MPATTRGTTGGLTAAEIAANDAEDDIRLAIYRLAIQGYEPAGIAYLVRLETADVSRTLAEYVENGILADDGRGGYRTVRDNKTGGRPRGTMRVFNGGRLKWARACGK